MMSQLEEISGPYRFPLLGHTPYLWGGFPSGKIHRIAEERGGLWRVQLPNSTFIAITRFQYMDELCDESRFEKTIHGGQIELKRVVKDGLFTAHTEDESWGRAHRILLPGFGSKAMGSYLPVMNSVSRLLVETWGGSGQKAIDVNRDMTMVSLEIIGVCGFDYHFADFEHYRESPFVKKMKSMFYDANLSTVFSESWMNILFFSKYRRGITTEVMTGVVDNVIEKRLARPEDYAHKKDFLNLMLEGSDSRDDSKLDAKNIRYQLITFLAAGYETTASLLGLCIYYLLKHEEVMAKARERVDEIFDANGDADLSFKDIGQMGYLKMMIHETLRLWPTGSGFFLRPKAKTTLQEKYEVTEEDVFFISLPGLHRDKEIWGSRPEVFDPENFSPENSKARPRNAFKPFGNGMRACIGQHFAITEVQVILAFLLRNFELIDYTNYQLRIDESVTLKARHFYLKVNSRQRG
ncbi:MAG: cytochrome P450 [Myxococcota bacterium]|nr:cytochrome P450 [Myxococcota bacterium]